MSLVWAIPVAVAALASVFVALAAHPLADEAGSLADDVRRLRELRRPLAAAHDVLTEADALVAGARARPVPDGHRAGSGTGLAPGAAGRPGPPA